MEGRVFSTELVSLEEPQPRMPTAQTHFHSFSRTTICNARFAMEGVEVGKRIRSAALALLRWVQDCMAVAVYKPAPAGMLLNRTCETHCHVIGQ